MVLFQIFMNGYTTINGVNRIQGTAINPFRGKCRIRFINYNFYFTTAKAALLRVDSDELYAGNYDFKIIVPLDSSLGIGLSKDGYWWDTYLTSPTITLDVLELNQEPNSSTPIPSTAFSQGLFSFDIEELEKN